MSAQPGYYSRPGLAYYLAGEVPVGALYPYNEGYYRKLNLHFMKETVARINPAEHVLNMAGGRIVPYNRLLVATGATEILGKKNKVVGVRTDDGQVTP